MAKNNNKRDRILTAAAELFMNNGFHNTKIIDIANAAGVGKGTVYQYFNSKEQLFETLFREKILDTCQKLEEILSHRNSSAGKLLEYVAFEYTMATEMELSPKVLYGLMTDFQRGNTDLAQFSIRQLITSRFEILYRIIAEGIESGEFTSADPLMATTTILGAINSYHFFNLALFKDIQVELHPLLCERATNWEHKDFCEFLLTGLTGSKHSAVECA